jgi:hypothetical protein
VLVAALLFGAAAAPAQACNAGSAARAQHDGPRRAPLIIGDSTMIIAAPLLGRRGLEANAKGCRQFGAGVAMLRGRRRARTLPRIAILALGANGPASSGAIAEALRIVGRRRVLGLVTPRNSGSTQAAMRRAAHRHPDRVQLLDWARHSAGHGSWFGDDGLHVNHGGALAFARFVRRRVAPFADPPVRDLRLPRAIGRSKRCSTIRRFGVSLRVYVVRGRSRVTCTRARRLARRPPLRPISGWTAYDWTATGRKPWRDVLVRRDRRVVIATVVRR